MKSALITLLLISTIIQLGCHTGASGTFVNANIDPAIKKQIEPLNKKLIEGLASKNAKELKQLMAPVLIERSGSALDSSIKVIGDGINSSEYTVMDEYYTKNTAINISNTLISSLGNDQGYIVNYLALNKEMYASLLVTKNGYLSGLIIAIYGKCPDGWKLNILNAGPYKLLGKTSADYYNEAKKNYDKGELLDATDKMVIASQIASPGGQYFKFKNGEAIKAFYDKLIKEANEKYKMPFSLTQIKTRPQIFSVTPQYLNGPPTSGFFPYIAYKSNIDLKDTTALKAENRAIQEATAGMFKGITKNNKYILYRAFKDLPGPAASKESYGFVQTVQ